MLLITDHRPATQQARFFDLHWVHDDDCAIDVDAFDVDAGAVDDDPMF